MALWRQVQWGVNMAEPHVWQVQWGVNMAEPHEADSKFVPRWGSTCKTNNVPAPHACRCKTNIATTAACGSTPAARPQCTHQHCEAGEFLHVYV